MSATAATSAQLQIGFDLDGVVYDFRRAMSEYLISIGRTDCTIESALPDWDFFEGWGLTLKEYLDLYRAGVDAGYVLRVGPPLPGSVEAMRVLTAAGHSVHIVTDRSVESEPGAAKRYTKEWLDEHGFLYDSLTISSDKTVVPTDFFVDDRYENYLARTQAGQNCHLLNRPWNVGLGDNNTLRVNTLDDFVKIILDSQRAALLTA